MLQNLYGGKPMPKQIDYLIMKCCELKVEPPDSNIWSRLLMMIKTRFSTLVTNTNTKGHIHKDLYLATRSPPYLVSPVLSR